MPVRPSTWEPEQENQSPLHFYASLGLHSEFQVILNYKVRPYLQQTEWDSLELNDQL